MIDHPYADLLLKVEKPSRYVGGEYNMRRRRWEDPRLSTRFVLCFPDLYEIGMSHLGTKILYSLLNDCDDLLMERCLCPWFDMERELRRAGLPLLSLENRRPLSEFDVVGFSLQYELTYSNVLTMLDLGGIPLRAAKRGDDDPVVIAGGPSATHPETMAPFIDAFLVGDGEEALPELLRLTGRARAAGLGREAILRELAELEGVYCHRFYKRQACPVSGLMYVTGPKVKGLPGKIRRRVLPTLAGHPFPDDSPVALSEAVFDRLSIELARGCTEGCRFCQAGMIYRPVRERDPEEVIERLHSALRKGGYDEASLTSLSPADYSCLAPLVPRLMEGLRPLKVGLGISSLRAYGLSEQLLDEIASVKATGLTFAPEAGSRRLRDVINKNIGEEDLYATCHRVFSRGWSRIKLYFMMGLPSERDEDLAGIMHLAREALRIGRGYRGGPRISVSVSSHVPKPHTPFQWCAMDRPEELERKWELLWNERRPRGIQLKRHDPRLGTLEGILGRGDIRCAELLEAAWRRGARFDSWDDRLNWTAWRAAIKEWEEQQGLDHRLFLDALPLEARLPWDHIHVGLEEGFLAREYRRALAGKPSPPCGKAAGQQVPHGSEGAAKADKRPLVCYDCGFECDLENMRAERIRRLGRLERVTQPRDEGQGEESLAIPAGSEPVSQPGDSAPEPPRRVRLRYRKLGPARLLSQLDLVRSLPQVLRRSGLSLHFSRGFKPKPVISYGPALGLGAAALEEYLEFSLADDPSMAPAMDELCGLLNSVAPQGLEFTGARLLEKRAPKLAAALCWIDLLLVLPDHEKREDRSAGDAASAEERLGVKLEEGRARGRLPVQVIRKGRVRELDLLELVESAKLVKTDPWAALAGIPAGREALLIRQRTTNATNLRPAEICEALLGPGRLPAMVLRLACRGRDEEGNPRSLL